MFQRSSSGISWHQRIMGFWKSCVFIKNEFGCFTIKIRSVTTRGHQLARAQKGFWLSDLKDLQDSHNKSWLTSLNTLWRSYKYEKVKIFGLYFDISVWITCVLRVSAAVMSALRSFINNLVKENYCKICIKNNKKIRIHTYLIILYSVYSIKMSYLVLQLWR